MSSSFWDAITRKKVFFLEIHETKFARVLNLFDLTALGVGTTLGLGVYLITGTVAYNIAGPSVTISFVIGAIASILSGLCYIEFAARLPSTGSVYNFSYATIGELVAYIMGSILFFGYAMGTSTIARGLSGYFDNLFKSYISKIFYFTMPKFNELTTNILAEHLDFFSIILIIIVMVLLAGGVKASSRINNTFIIINIFTIITIIYAGICNADLKNWKISQNSIPEECQSRAGVGGFMPFGVAGIMAGASKCFNGYVGFDCIASTGEEAKKPEKNIPLSIVLSLIIMFILYFFVSTVLTMMWPYYLQNPDAAFVYVFQELGWINVKWIVTIGALFALGSSLFGIAFPIPRVIYSMAADGLLFKKLSVINENTKTPINATIACGVLTSFMALFFNLNQLIDLISIGGLISYTIVAICVLILRYRVESDLVPIKSNISIIIISLYTIISMMWCACVHYIKTYNPLLIVIITILTISLLFCIFILSKQTISNEIIIFRVPFVPVFPCLSIILNIYLMFQLHPMTWLRLFFWLIGRLVMYLSCGIKSSVIQNQSNGSVIESTYL